jgi:hypothetical protein
VGVEPIEQRSGDVEDDREKARACESVEQRRVDVIEVLLEDVAEISDRLMEVQAEDETDRGHIS